MSLPPPPITKKDLFGHETPAGIYYAMRQHSIKSVHLEALAWSVDDALANLSIDAGNLPPGGNEGDHLVINDLGKPEWMPPEDGLPSVDGAAEGWHIVLVDDGQGGLEPSWAPHEDADGGNVGWHEISRGDFLMSDNFVYGPQVNRPTDVGKVAGHGAINATSPPILVYHLAETDDGEGGTKLFDLSGDEFVMEEDGATDYRATAIIEGNEYPVTLNSSSLRVTDPDGMNTEHVSSWTFTALGISWTAPVEVELVVEPVGGGGAGGESWCPETCGELAAGCGSGGAAGDGSGGGSADLQPLLDRISELEKLHEGTWDKHGSI